MNNQQRAENAIKCIKKLLTTRAKQGKKVMGDRKNGRCCLAVMSDELGIPYSPDDRNSHELKEAIGLYYKEGEVNILEANGTQRPCLTAMNDGGRYTFKMIAKEMIETAHLRFRPGVAKLIKKHFAEKSQ